MFPDAFIEGFFKNWPKTGEVDEEYENELITGLGEALFPLIHRFGFEGIEPIGLLIARLNQDDRQAALYLMKKSPSIIERLLSHGEELVLNVFRLGNEMVPYGSNLAVRFLEMSPEIIKKSDYETLAKTAAFVCDVARDHLATAVSLIEKSPVILESIGFDGLEKVGNFSAAIARSTRTYSLKAIESSTSLIEQLIDMGGKSFVLAVYELGLQMADDDWSDALELVGNSPAIAGRLISKGNGALFIDLYERAGRAVPFRAKLILALLDTAPSLIDRLGPAGLERVWRCILTMAIDNVENAVPLLKKSPDIVDGLLSRFNSSQVGAIYDLGCDLAGLSSSIPLSFLSVSVDLVNRLDYKKIKVLSDLAKEIGRTGHAVTEAFLSVLPALIERVGLEGIKKIAELCIPIAQGSWETASRLLIKSPALIDRLGLEGLKVIGNFSSLLAGESWSSAVHLLDKCSQIIDGLLKVGDASIISSVCHLGGRIAQFNARLAVSLLDRSPELIELMGFNNLEKVAMLAQRTGTESWTTAVTLVEMSPSIIERVGYDGLERIAAVAGGIAQENSYAAVSLLEKSPDLIDHLLVYGQKSLALHIYELAEEAIPINWRMASTLVERSPELLSRIGVEGLEKWSGLINRTSQINEKIAKCLLDLSIIIIDKIGFKGLETIAELASVIFRHDGMAALSVVEKSPLMIDRLGNIGGLNVSLAVYSLMAKVARTSPAVAVRLLEKSPEFIDWVGIDGFGMIADFIGKTAETDEEKALSFLKPDSSTFADFMENIPKGLDLKMVKPVLSTYLRALLGRRVEIGEADTAYTDGLKVYLPRRIKEFQDKGDNFIFYKVVATHQEAHLEYGSFEFDIEKIHDCIERIVSLYGTKTKEGASDIDRFLHLFPEPDLARDLFNLMEDFRIEEIMKREYPVLGDEISWMNIHSLSKRRSPQKMTNPKQRVMEMIGQSLLAGKSFDDADDPVLPILQKAKESAGYLKLLKADVHDAARIAVDLYLMIDKTFKNPYRSVEPMSKPLDQDMVSKNIGSFGKTSQHIQDRILGRSSVQPKRSPAEAEAKSGVEADTQPTQRRPSQEDIQQRAHRIGKDQGNFQGPLGGGKQESGDSDQEMEETGRMVGSMKFDSREKIERLLRAVYHERGITPKEIERRLESMHQNEIDLFLHNLEASLEKKTELQSERGTSLYPEWGEDINGYRSNWARIREQTLPARSLDFYLQTLEKHAGLLKKIRREFQILKPEGFTKRKRQYDGDDIDLDAVVEYWVDLKAGFSPSEKNYNLYQKKKRDIAVAFLIDMSRSTKGVAIEQEKESLIIMSEALHEVGDAFAIFGFSGDNRDNVDFYRIKNFDDPYDDKVKKRISAIEDRLENRDGTAIRHTIVKLRGRSERTKMLILLSDGKPVDKEYSGPYAIEDTRMALKEARHLGIKTICITVDRTAAEYLPRMFSYSSWTVIDDVVKLPEKITRIYRMLTA